MNAYLDDRVSYSSFDAPPVLVAGGDHCAVARAASSISGFGLRHSEICGFGGAAVRISQQPAASAVWLELGPGSLGEVPDELLEQLNATARDGRQGAIVVAPLALLDRLSAVLHDDVQLLVDPSEADRISALATAFALRGDRTRFNDVASDRNAERLRQLSDEVSRIASTLARLSTGPGVPAAEVFKPSQDDAPAISAEFVRSIIRGRRLRARYFPEDLFADPAWDMLLDLLQAEIAHLRVPVSSLCIAAAVPATTALRWLKTLVQQGLFIRQADPHDGRRVFVQLAPDTSKALRNYFAELGPAAVI